MLVNVLVTTNVEVVKVRLPPSSYMVPEDVKLADVIWTVVCEKVTCDAVTVVLLLALNVEEDICKCPQPTVLCCRSMVLLVV